VAHIDNDMSACGDLCLVWKLQGMSGCRRACDSARGFAADLISRKMGGRVAARLKPGPCYKAKGICGSPFDSNRFAIFAQGKLSARGLHQSVMVTRLAVPSNVTVQWRRISRPIRQA